MSFEQFRFDPRILSGIEAAGFEIPTPIQEQAIPVVLNRRDVLGLAQTGTGKTAAFMLPILDRLMKSRSHHIRALILAPTRELAEQTHQATVSLGRSTGLRSAAIYGGVSKGPQLVALRRGVDIVVACPGRLLDHVEARAIDLSHVEILVVDEADRMCDMGFLPDVRRILTYLPKERQTLFFSATMPPEIRALADHILDRPETVQVDTIGPAKTVAHALFPVPDTQKTAFLLAMLKQTATGRVLVFTRTKYRARNLSVILRKAGHRVAALQGNMTQAQRQTAIDGFRNGRFDVLVATDVAARGIDVSDISHVINFDMPNTADAYIHRIGRTGRVEKSGEAFTLASPGDGLMVRDIERVLGKRIDRRRLPGFDYGTFSPEAQFQSKSTSGPTLPRSFRQRTSRTSSVRAIGATQYVSRHRPAPAA
ncbi:MAG: DEAD/DEAH box helicase [Thermotogota bacterium]